jgi:PAS domain S-box-containing protein
MISDIGDNGAPATVATIPATELVGMEDRVRTAQFVALYRQGRITNLASPVLAAFVGYVLLSNGNVGPIAGWLSFVVLAAVLRGVVHHRFEPQVSARSVVSEATKYAFLASICVSGLAWGAAMPLLFPMDNLALQVFLIVVVMGMGAGAAVGFGPYFPALAVYLIPLTLPAVATLLIQQTLVHVALGCFGLMFLVILLLLGSSGHRSFAMNVRLEFENALLALGLEDAQRRLGDAVDSMSEAFALFDADDCLVLANEPLRQIVPVLRERSPKPLSYEEFVGVFATSVLAGAPQEQFDSWVERFLRRHRMPGETFEVELADGHWLRVSEQSTSDNGIVSIFSDLTELKRREAALRESEERFRDFTQAASDWVLELDADLRFTAVSGRYAEVTGRDPESLIGLKLTDYPSLNQDADWHAVATAFAQRQPFHNRRISRPDSKGEPFQFLFSAVPVFADDGEFQGYRGTGSDITAIVRAEALAREARKQLFDAIESIPAAFVLLGRDGRLILWNSRAPEFLRADRDLIRTGAAYEDLVRSSAESGRIIDAHGNEAAWIADQMEWFNEPEIAKEFRLTDGRFLQKLGRRTADGGVVAIFTDITDIRRDQQELAEKTALLQTTLEGMGEGILVLDQDRRVILANNQLQQLLELPEAATSVGTSFSEIIGQLERDGVVGVSDAGESRRLSITDHFDTRNAFQTEHVSRSGKRLLVRASPLEDGCWVLLLNDVTAQRTAVAALEESEDRYRQLVENSPDFISIHKDGRFIFVNPAGARLVGAPSTEAMVGRRALDFVHPDYHDEFRLSGTTVQAAGTGAFYEFRGLRDDGSVFDVEGTTVEFTYRGGPAILSVVRDITLRKLAQAQLVQTSKLATLGELAAGITHELNQPLNLIRMAADSSLILMEQGKTDKEFEREQFERISAQAVRMADIISHMATFSRRVDDDGDREVIDPYECVRAAVSMVRDQYAADDVNIDVDIPETPSRIYGNTIRLEQVILNLLTNARDAVVLDKVDPESGRTFKEAKPGRIKVSLRHESPKAGEPDSAQNQIVIRIEDNGGGIPAAALDRVFDPFYTTKRTGEGTGLGLAIGYGIVDSMGGRISVSNGLEGARFEVWIPLVNTADIAEPVGPSIDAETSAKKRA